MVWTISYRPKPDSYPSADLIEGTRQLVLEDTTSDGGGFSLVRRKANQEGVLNLIACLRSFAGIPNASYSTMKLNFEELSVIVFEH